MMNNQIFDVLYGKISYSQNDQKLFETKELQRLRRVTVSTVPNWCEPVGECCSRFEHSLGVWHLAKITGVKKEFQDIVRNLEFAALAHDLATPPFSHGTERIQKLIFGKNHEELIEEIIHDSEFGKEVKKQGGNLDFISSLVTGKDRKYGSLINGVIDLDNLDNTLRYGLSTGLFRKRYYSPAKMAQNFSLKDGKLVLLSDDSLVEWESCRKITYDFIFKKHPEIIMFRVMDLAYRAGDINKEFFSYNDNEAFDFLRDKCNSATQKIIERIANWDFYDQTYYLEIDNSNDKVLNAATDSNARIDFTNTLCKELNLPEQDIAVGIFKNKAYKKIDLPILNKETLSFHEPKQKDTMIVRVDVYRPKQGIKKEINNLVKEYFSL